MIQINQCRLPITYSPEERQRKLEQKICAALHIKDPGQFTWEIRRRSIDARKKPEIYYSYTLWVKIANEEKIVRGLKNPKVQLVEEKIYPNFKYFSQQGDRVALNQELVAESVLGGNQVSDSFDYSELFDDLRKSPDYVGESQGKSSDYVGESQGKSSDCVGESRGKLPNCVQVLHGNSLEVSKEIVPVIIGAGPAGLFAAFLLTEYGCPPLVLDRGKPISERRKDVDRFWSTGILDPNSNVLFGEGGAGTFSDGKLNTSDKDKTGRIAYVLKTFARFGAPGEIIYDQKPHIGTDVLAEVITSMRQYLEEKGCRFQFETTVEDFCVEDGKLRQILCTHKGVTQILPANQVVLAIGHSSRDTFQTLHKRGILMEAKNFAVGFRVEHPQKMIDEALYGKENLGKLPAATYKLTSNFANGRSVYSFCMCPGGYVVNASSEANRMVVNGMSYAARDGANANSAIVVSVTKEDFRNANMSVDPLVGMYYQMEIEEAAYRLGNGAIPQQLYGDYRQDTVSHAYGEFDSQTKGARRFANLRGIFTEEIEQSFLQGMEHFSHIIPGFDRADAILSGVESRTSSPVRILRDESLQCTIAQGLYPCGEGAGYAGGIVSAAVDGLRVAEAILKLHQII